MRRLFLTLVLFVVSLPLGAAAQNPYAAARFVNGTMISNYDVDQRVRFLSALGVRAPDTQEEALRLLTEEAVKSELATSLGMTITEQGFEEAITQYAEQRQMSVGGLRARLSSAGVANTSFDNFLRAGLLWREIVRNRFRDRARPTDADMENLMSFSLSATQTSLFIREIAIPFAERGVDGARSFARELRQRVRAGESFATLASQFSRTRSAQQGGAIGWRPANRLPPAIAALVLPLRPGQVSSPLEVPAGVILFQVVDTREETVTSPNDILTSFVKLDVPIEDDPDGALTKAATALEEFETCRDAELRIPEFGPDSGRFGPVAPQNLPDELNMALMNLDAGESGLAEGRGDVISALFLCSRAVDINDDQVEQLRAQLFNQRLGRFADDYLQDLLADAVIRDE